MPLKRSTTSLPTCSFSGSFVGGGGVGVGAAVASSCAVVRGAGLTSATGSSCPAPIDTPRVSDAAATARTAARRRRTTVADGTAMRLARPPAERQRATRAASE